jgi:hypothetical protein
MAMLAGGVGGAVAGLILGLACIGYGVFQIVAPCREPSSTSGTTAGCTPASSYYSLPRMKHRLDEDWLAMIAAISKM